ncbi:putative T7SS-secreted protein, partial [Planotetraspora phitsanulokensis]|uniref:putative T7SS-secreted protein n=1 Tax=Planotetraspora phitsanulokensis TaxID=575192 RepID=UPI003571444E
MGQRPTDWNAIGLGGDPTPGDPDRIDEVSRSMADLGRVAREIDEALTAVLNKAGEGAWIGQTADALREKISGPLRAFVQSIAEAFESSSQALNTYSGVMRQEQWRADNALGQGRGLAEDDPRRGELATTARQAGDAQAEAGRAAGATISRVARGIKQPVSDCDLFWEAFGWLAIVLIIPALIFGGPIALLAIGVNLTLFVKTAIDFAQGKASLLDFFLAGLGLIAPTTKAVPILKIISAGAKITWGGLKSIGQTVFTFFRGMFTNGGFRPFAFLPGIRDFASVAGGWVKSGGLWVMASLHNLPALAGMAVHNGGLIAIQGIRAIPGIARGVPSLVSKGALTSLRFLQSEFGGSKWLRLVLPVDAAEIGKYGLKGALRIGLVDRGLMGNFRFGAPLVGAAGRTVSVFTAVTPPPSVSVFAHGTALDAMPVPVRHLDALLDVPRAELTRMQLGDFTGPGNLQLPPFTAGAANLAVSPPHPGHIMSVSPPSSHLSAHLVDGLSSGSGLGRLADALVDTPIGELRMIAAGDFANWTSTSTGVRLDVGAGGLGVTSHLAGRPMGDLGSVGVPSALGLPGTSLPGVAGAAHPGALLGGLPAPVNTHLPQTPHVGGTHAIDLVAGNPAAGASGTLHAPAAAGLTGIPVAPTTNALDLLSAPAHVNRAEGPALGAGAGLSDHVVSARGADQVGMHLHESAPRPDVVTRPASPATVTPSTALETVASITMPAPATRGGADAFAGAPAAPAPHGTAGPSSPPTLVRGHGGDAGPPNAGSGRPTGAQIEQLWLDHDQRVAALFGASDDPARLDRIQAWSDLVGGKRELTRVEGVLDDLSGRPGSGSSGPSSLHVQAQQAVDAARQNVDDSLAHLTGLGVDPARIERGMAEIVVDSVRERPRLLGGSSGSGLPDGVLDDMTPPHAGEGAFTGAPPAAHTPGPSVSNTTVEDALQLLQHEAPHTHGAGPAVHTGDDIAHLGEDAVALGGPGPERWISTSPDGALQVVDRTGSVQEHLTVTARPDGGFQVTDAAAGGSFVRYDGGGVRVQAGTPLGEGNVFAVL